MSAAVECWSHLGKDVAVVGLVELPGVALLVEKRNALQTFGHFALADLVAFVGKGLGGMTDLMMETALTELAPVWI